MSAVAGAAESDARAAPRWLVTGADGQLGRSLVAVAPEFATRAVGLGPAQLDVTDPRAVARLLDELDPHVVVNCAALTDVDGCEEGCEEVERVNAHAPGMLAEACRGRALLVHLSTDFVFSGEAPRPIAEDAKPAPRNVYGRTKLAGEEAVRRAGGEHLIVRSQWLFGPGGNFVRRILERARLGRNLAVVEDQVGRPTWTAALARGLLDAVARGARGTLHVACEGACSRYDFAREIVRQGARRGCCPETVVEPVSSDAYPSRAERPLYGVLDLRQSRALGIALPHWSEALAAYLEAEEEGRDA